MAEISDLDPVDANNTTRFPEGMQFRNVNDGVRADEGLLARWFRDTNGSLAASGSAGAYAVTANRTIASYVDNLIIGFTANHTNTGAVTLAVSGLVPKTIVRPDGSTMLAGDIPSGNKVLVAFNSSTDKFQLLSMPATSLSTTALAVGTVLAWPVFTVPSWALECDGSAVSRTTYAALFEVVSTRYGVGDGSTTFNLPNYKDYFLRGFDAAGTDAASRTDRGDGTTGAEIGTKQAGAFASHTHTASVTDPGHAHNTTMGETQTVQTDEPDATTRLSGALNGGANTTGITVSNASTGGTETRPKNITVKWIIVAIPALMLPQAAIGKNETWIGARNMTARAANGAGSATRDSGSNDVTQPVFDFDTSADEFAQFEWAPPKRWDAGTVTARVYWTNDAGLTTETVRFTLAGVAISNDDLLNATFGTAVNITDTWIAQADLHISDESGLITIGGTPAIADLVMFQLARDVSEDNLTGDARVLGVKLFWTANATSDD